MKKVLKYISITLLLLLGLCCVGVLYLFFIPGSTLFSITYISYSETYVSNDYLTSSISKIDLDNYKYDIEIKESKTDKISVKVYNNSFGFVLTKNKTLSVSEEVENGTLYIEVTEPRGFATPNSSLITIYVPKDYPIDLDFTNEDSRTKINDENLVINNLTYKSNKGNFTFKKGRIVGNINVNVNKADFTIEEAVETNANNVNLKIGSGAFVAKSEVLGNINILENDRGVIIFKECADLYEYTTYSGGRIEANRVTNVNIQTSDSILIFGEVTDGVTIILTASGSVSINTLSGYSNIETNDGDVLITKCLSDLFIRSEYGNLSIYNAYYHIDAGSAHGNTFVKYAEDAPVNSDTDSTARKFAGSTNTGTINCLYADNINISIEKDGFAEVTFNNVVGENNINSLKGNVLVRVNKDSAYKLHSKTTTGNSRIHVAQADKHNGWTDLELLKYINCTSSSTELNIITDGGNILLIDSTFY